MEAKDSARVEVICIENLSSELQESLTLGTAWSRKGNRVEANTAKASEVVGVADTRHMMKIKTAAKLVQKELKHSNSEGRGGDLETRGQQASKAYQMCQNSE